jgi:hypothetical protein
MGELTATAVVMVLLIASGLVLVDGDTIPHRPVPWCAVGLTALAVAGVVLQAVWPGATAALDADPARSGWWRHGTAVLIQNGGPAGVVFNLVTLAAVAALAQWWWSAGPFVALVGCAVVVPVVVGAVLGGTAPDDPSTFAGSSGLTFFLGGTLAGALVVRGPGRRRLLGAGAVVAATAAWSALGDAHGLVALEGAALGVLAAVALRARLDRQDVAPDDDGQAPTPTPAHATSSRARSAFDRTAKPR